MKNLNKMALLLAAAAFSSVASAQAANGGNRVDNWVNASGTPWKNASDLCWRDASWTPATAAKG